MRPHAPSPRPLIAAFTVLVLLLLPARAHGASDWVWPVEGEVITPYRNGDDPYAAGQHRGIDIAARVSQPVVAATGGTVSFAGRAGSSGLTVAVETSQGLTTSYLHLSSIDVRRGDRLGAGERLGAVGTTGRRSTEAPHLHFGVRETGRDHAYRDPLDFLPAPPAPRRDPEPPPAPPVPVTIPLLGAPATAAASTGGGAPSAAPAPAGSAAANPAGLPAPSGHPVLTGHPDSTGHPAPAGHPPAHGRPSPGQQSGSRLFELSRDKRGAGDAGARGALSHGDGRRNRTGELDLGRSPSGSPTATGAGGPGSEKGSDPNRSQAPAGDAGRGGFSVGWLFALIGLVAAAIAMSQPEPTMRAAGRARAAFLGLLRPLTGRG